MPKLRRLNGLDVIRILEQFSFVVIRIRGSHHIIRRTIKVNGIEETQTVNVPVHGSKPLAPGMLKRIYRDTSRYIPEEQLKAHFLRNSELTKLQFAKGFFHVHAPFYT